MKIILAGDIGGTHSRLARARVAGARVELERVARYRNAEHASLEAILADFLATFLANPPANGTADALPWAACCLAVAGPTDGRRVRLTNLDWQIDSAALARRFAFPRALLVNDFAAVGWGLDSLTAADISPLQRGPAIPAAARVALGAGTGLGVCPCTWQQDHYRPQPSEGGHIGFSPLNPEQDRLLGFLRDRHGGRVSLERILSGPGIIDLYRFCVAEAGRESGPLLAAEQPAAAISAAGLAATDPAAGASLRLFAQIYGQAAGDLALLTRAEGGVFLAGGIAPQLLPVLAGEAFLAGFHAKGRFSDWMRGLPVAVIMDPDIGLKGAAIAGAIAGA